MTAIKSKVKNRGSPPTAFLNELVDWGKLAATDIFAPNTNPADIYANVKQVLGPWEGLLHRRAVMLEIMRVHAGFESSWNWKEGVDTTNKTSIANIDSEETGIFQVSFDSTYLSDVLKAFANAHEIDTPYAFIPKMKYNHKLALEYYARLVRISVAWAGPLLRHEIDPWLSRDAVAEFMELLQ